MIYLKGNLPPFLEGCWLGIFVEGYYTHRVSKGDQNTKTRPETSHRDQTIM